MNPAVTKRTNDEKKGQKRPKKDRNEGMAGKRGACGWKTSLSLDFC